MKFNRAATLLAAVAIAAGACTPGGAGGSPTTGGGSPGTNTASPPVATQSAPVMGSPVGSPTDAASPGGSPAGQYVIGVSNTVQANGWREQMICSVKAESLASGKVSKVVVAHRNTDAAGQLSDIRNLIGAGVDAIIVNPTDPNAIVPALTEAIAAGITVVAVDQGVNEQNAYLMSNNQEEYGYLGAKWLFETMGKKGQVVYQRGIPGAQADTDRDKGFKRALAEYPEVKIAAEHATNWAPATAAEQINTFIASGAQVDGVWTSGVDSTIVTAFKTAGKPVPPIVGADNSEFVRQLLTEQNLVGAAVTNPAAVGGAGVALALQVLDGKAPSQKQQLLKPEVWDNQTDAGKGKLTAANDPSLDPLWPLNITIPNWTTYTKEQLVACKGPGE